MRLAIVILGFTLAPFSEAGEKTKLEWLLKEGEVVEVEHVVLRKENLETKGKSFPRTSTLTTQLSFTVKEKTAAGLVVLQKIESVKHKAEGVDSPGTLADKLAGNTFTITLTPGSKIAKFEGYEAFIKKLADGNAEVEKTARLLLPEDVLRQPSEELWTFQPGRPVAKGEQWRREASFSLAPFGVFKGTQLYTYEGPDKAGEIITAKGTLAFIPQTANTGPFRVSRALLKTDAPSGRYLFDANKGRLEQATHSILIKGQLSLDVNGNPVDMEVTIDQTTTLRVK